MMEKIVDMFEEWSAEFVVFSVGIMTMVVGVWMMLPMNTFDASPAYDFLNGAVPELLWGAVVAIPGLLKVYGCLKRKANIVLYGCYAGFVVWLFFMVGFLLANPRNAIIPITAWIALMNGWFALHLGLQRRAHERQK